jgi:hypothetical protein
VKELTLDFNVRTMQYELEGTPCQMPSAGMSRAYSDGAYAQGDQFLLAGTRAGELCVFAIAPEPPSVISGSADAAAPAAVQPARKPGVFRACVPVSAGTGGVHALAVHGRHVWMGAGDGKVKHFEGEDQSWAMEAEAQLDGRVVSLSLTADRRGLIAGTSAGRIYSLDASTLRAQLLCAAHTAPVVAATFGALSSEVVATASADGTVRVWDLNSYECTYSATRAGQAPTCLFFGGELGGGCPLLLSGWSDGAVYCYDPTANADARAPPALPSGAAVARGFLWAIAQAHAGAVTALALTDTALLTAGRDGKLRVWSLGSRRCEAEFAEHSKPISAMVVDSADSGRVHTCGLDQLVRTALPAHSPACVCEQPQPACAQPASPVQAALGGHCLSAWARLCAQALPPASALPRLLPRSQRRAPSPPPPSPPRWCRWTCASGAGSPTTPCARGSSRRWCSGRTGTSSC